MNPISVDVDKLTRRFGDFTAVDAVTFKVREGEIFGFLGANGAGKTTTIRMLCGLLSPSAGIASVAGFDIYTQTDELKQHIGYMSQQFSLYNDLTVAENIEFFGGVYGLGDNKVKGALASAKKVYGLGSYLKRLTGDIPLGWKQRLALICAQLHHPKILFLDEPTSGVDPISRREFWDIIYDLAQKGTTVFVTTHFMEEAEYCHRLSIMYEGAVIALGAPDELKAIYKRQTVEEVFIHLVDR